jgi:Zn-dependent alcohol dehydrogenases, class III
MHWKNKKVNAGGLTTFNSFAVVSENKLTKLNSIKHDYRNTLLLGCTASTAIGSVEKLSNLKKTDIIAVSGCGSIGLSIIKYAKIIGVKKIIAIDINKNKLNFSKKFGANYILNLKKNNLSNFFNKKFPNGVNHFFECTGKINVISDAFECLNKSNGKEILIGVPKFKQKAKFYTLDLHLGKQLIGCKGGNFLPDKDLNRYLSIVNNKKFLANKMITNEIVLEDLNDVFSDMRKNSLKGKCIINFKKDC